MTKAEKQGFLPCFSAFHFFLGGFLHLIDASIHGVHFLGSHFGHYLAEVLGVNTTEEHGEALLKPVEDVRCRQLERGFTFLRQGEYLIESLFFRRVTIESLVVFLDFQLFFLREPVTFACFQFPLQLSIKLRVVDG